MKRLAGLGFAVLILIILATFNLFLFREDIARALEDWTGETSRRQQLESFFHRLTQRPVETADLVPVAHNGVNPYGANTFFEQEVEEWKLRKSMEMLSQAGVRWVRQQMPWVDIETPAKGQYVDRYNQNTWHKYDRFINLAKEYGLEIVARLDNPPNWSRVDNSVHNRPPDNLEDYGDFVYNFVRRYQSKIRYFQIWNEPNVYPEWGDRPADAVGYVELLKTAYRRAKEANPEAVIISAPLAQTLGTPDGKNESDLTYLQKMYDAGAKDYFDILGAQSYGLWTGPGDRRADEAHTNFSRLRLQREIMVKNGDANKSMWVSEMGWDALPLDFPGPATHGRVNEEQQARYTIQAYHRAQEEWPWVGVLFYWHFRRVSDRDRVQVDFYYRLVDPDFTPRPVYNAYKDIASRPPLVRYGYRQEDHWALNYEGSWSFAQDQKAVLGGYAISSNPGDSLTVRFKGTELYLATVRSQNGARAYVTVDGMPARILPLDDRKRATLALSSREEVWQTVIPLAGGLPDGEHTVRLEVAEGGGTFVVDGVIVNSKPTYYLAKALGIMNLVFLGLAVIIFVRRTRKG